MRRLVATAILFPTLLVAGALLLTLDRPDDDAGRWTEELSTVPIDRAVDRTPFDHVPAPTRRRTSDPESFLPTQRSGAAKRLLPDGVVVQVYASDPAIWRPRVTA